MNLKELWNASNPKIVDPGPLLLMFILEIIGVKIKYKFIFVLLLLIYRAIYWIIAKDIGVFLVQGSSYLLAFVWILADYKISKTKGM